MACKRVIHGCTSCAARNAIQAREAEQSRDPAGVGGGDEKVELQWAGGAHRTAQQADERWGHAQQRGQPLGKVALRPGLLLVRVP